MSSAQTRLLLSKKLLCRCPICNKSIYGQNINIQNIDTSKISTFPFAITHVHQSESNKNQLREVSSKHTLTLYFDANLTVRDVDLKEEKIG